MSNWVPEIIRVTRIEPHPNADRLDIVYVYNEIPVVTSKGNFEIGDLAAYIPVDSIVPDTVAFDFLIPTKQVQVVDENGKCSHVVTGKKFEVGSVPEQFRIIKSKKIRNVYSQGILLKGLQWEQPKAISFSHTIADPGILHEEGNSIIAFFQLIKWEEPSDDESRFHKATGFSIKPPWFKVPYYDISNIQKYLDCLIEGEAVVITEKLHGSNIAVTHDGNQLWVKSRTLFKPRDEACQYWGAVIRANLEEKLAEYPMLTFFGEIYGFQKKGSVSFTYDTENGIPKIRFFDIYDVEARRYLDYDEFDRILEDLNIPDTPYLYACNWKRSDWEELKQVGNKNSVIGNHIQEGFVLRTRSERYEPKLDSRMQLKYVNPEYQLLK